MGSGGSGGGGRFEPPRCPLSLSVSGGLRGWNILRKFFRFQTLLDWLKIGPNWVVCFIVTLAPLGTKSNLNLVL